MTTSPTTIAPEVSVYLPASGSPNFSSTRPPVPKSVVGAVLPEVEAARRLTGGFFLRRLLFPQRLAARAVERGDEAVRVLGVDDAVDDNRRRLQIWVDPQFGKCVGECRVDRRTPPRHFQVLDV